MSTPPDLPLGDNGLPPEARPPDTQDPWKYLASLRGLDLDQRPMYFEAVVDLVASAVPAGAERDQLRRLLLDVFKGVLAETLDRALAVADFRQEHRETFVPIEALLEGARPDRAAVKAALLPLGRVLLRLKTRRQVAREDRALAPGLRDWFRPRLARLLGPNSSPTRPGELIDEAVDEAAALRLDEAQPPVDPAELERRRAELREAAAAVLAHPDPLRWVRDELPAMGLGGATTPVVLTYLAATSRLLYAEPGDLLAHLLLVASSGAGKNFAVTAVRRLHPPECWLQYEAASPMALIHDHRSFRHKVLVFAEMDSIPQDEQKVAASAVRSLLAENRLCYSVAVPDPGHGHTTETIDKAGPTVMLSTGLRRFPPQLDTRVFTYELSEDHPEVQSKLRRRGRAHARRDVREPDPALVAFQGYLQHLAPFRVWVPFAEAISEHASRSKETGPRVLRDFEKLISLIKSACVVRHARREQTADGVWVATLDDYATVFDLVGDTYQSSASGVSLDVRKVVDTVTQLYHAKRTAAGAPARFYPFDDETYGAVNASEAAKALNTSLPTVIRRIDAALKGGWLINRSRYIPESRQAYRLTPGDPMPTVGDGLPRPEVLKGGESGVNPLTGLNSAENIDTYELTVAAHRGGGALTGNRLEYKGEMAQLTVNGQVAPPSARVALRTPMRGSPQPEAHA